MVFDRTFDRLAYMLGNIDRLMAEPDYRERCVDRLVEILSGIEDYRGARRVFIP